MLRILILLVPIIAFGRIDEGDDVQYFRQIFSSDHIQDDLEGCKEGVGDERIDGFSLRLTNLQNTRMSPTISELPSWQGSYEMGGIFNNASEIDSDYFNADWGHEGAESNKISENEMGTCIYCSGGYGFDAGFDFIQEDIFSFHKYVNGRDIQINQPKMVDFTALGAGSDRKRMIFSEKPRYAHGSGEFRLFVPFMDVDYIKIGNNRVRVPVSARRSSNFVSSRDAIDRKLVDKVPGLCVVFHPISTNIPHDTTPFDSSKNDMDGAVMSSLRNKKVVDYNRKYGTHCPMPDWGYQGYFESFEEDCMERVTPRVNPGCRCKGTYEDIVCYNSESVMQMNCKDKTDGQKPEEILSEFKCSDYSIKLDDTSISCCSSEPGFYLGKDIGYACSYAVKNQEFSEKTLTNWSTGSRFTIER